MLKLQIKDSGSWRNLVPFDRDALRAVLFAALGLLRALAQPKTVLRVMDGDKLLYTCSAPDYIWRPAVEPAFDRLADADEPCAMCDGSGTWFGKACGCKSTPQRDPEPNQVTP
jgi:hypothetical protein